MIFTWICTSRHHLCQNAWEIVYSVLYFIIKTQFLKYSFCSPIPWITKP